MAAEHQPDLEPLLPWLKAEVRRGDPSSIAASSRALSAFDARDFAPSIDVPTAVVVTKDDHLIRPRRQHELAKAIPGTEVIEIDTAHNGWMVKPDEVGGALDKAVGLVAARIGRKG